ncbi:MAG: threonine synthase [Pseudomonadota bacterium]
MQYISTRGGTVPLTFGGVLLEGLARDGGLFVPQSWPQINLSEFDELRGASYETTAVKVLQSLVGTDFRYEELLELCGQAYRSFSHSAVAPLKQIGPSEWLLELFHGPTLAFKDFALQLLGLMFQHALARDQRRITIVGATSGDTGSAAIHACAGRANIDIFVLYPNGRVSEIQRRQMTTVNETNVNAIAINGSFDDCQAIVKGLFGDLNLRRQLSLAAINSINWARIAAQTVYYIYSGLRLGARSQPVRFVVPTGNFGDIYAGFAAAQMGLPVAELVVATNQNDILARFFETGRYERGDVYATLSPSMDIQVASNFERLLFEIHDRDGAYLAEMMSKFQLMQGIAVEADRLEELNPRFRAGRASELETLSAMSDIMTSCGEVIDPHTAVGVAIGRRLVASPRMQTVYLATAHPAKFPDAVVRAINQRPSLPAQLEPILTANEKFEVLPNDLEAVKSFIRERAAAP